MYRGELLFFLLVMGIFSIDFFQKRDKIFFEFPTLPPKITQWKLDSCTRTISVQAVAGGIPPYDFYVFQQDVLEPSNWQLFRWTKEQLPQISGLPPGSYRVKAVNQGVTSPSFSTNILEVSIPADPEIEVHGATSLCSGLSPAIAVQLPDLEGPLPMRWTTQVLQTPEEGEVLGYTSSSTISQFKISDSLVNTGKTLAKVSYQLQALVNGCLRPAGTVEVQVNPQARIEARISEDILCSGTTFTISLLPQSWGAIPMQVRWSAEVLSGQVSGLAEGGQVEDTAVPLIQTLVNRGIVPARVRYTFLPSFKGCDGIAEYIELDILPAPQLAPLQDVVACPTAWVSVPRFTSNFSGDSVVYFWEVSDPSIGLQGGTGTRIPDFQVFNSSMMAKQALVRVTPSFYSEGLVCEGVFQTFSITVRPPLWVEEELSNFGGFGVSCAGASDGRIKLHVRGGTLPGEELRYTYSWTGPNGFVSSSKDLEGLQAGVYTVLVTTGMGSCILEKSLTLPQPDPLWIQRILPTNDLVVLPCVGAKSGQIRVDFGGGSGEKRLFWTATDGGLVPAGMEHTSSLEGLQAGTYHLRIVDINGCSREQSFLVKEPEPLLLAQAKVDNSCFAGESGRLSVLASGGVGPYRYAWTGPNGFYSTDSNLQNLASGVYQVRVTDANSCSLVGPQLSIDEPDKLTLLQFKVDNGCFEGTSGSLLLNPSGGVGLYHYDWTGPNGFSSSEKDLHNLASGTYQVTVTDANGCTITGAPQTITEPTSLSLQQTKLDNKCFQGNTGSISTTASGGAAPYSYAWTGPDGFTSTTENLQNLVSGTYQVMVTDANGCTITGSLLTINEPGQLTLTQSKVDNACSQGTTGSISITASGGTAPYSYAWTGPSGFASTNEDLQNLVSGTYHVTVTDANGCAIIGAPQTITEPSPLTFTAQVQSETCADAKDGRIALTPTGGTAPYQYTWDHGATGPVATGLGPGTYRVTLRDQNGCRKTAEYVLLPVSVLQLEGTVTYQATQVPLQISAVLQSDAQGGSPPYTYRWNTGQTTPSLTVFTSGTYTLQLKDAKGCVQEKEFVVNLPLPLAIDVDVNTIPLCEEQSQESTLRLSIQGGLPPYQITWTMGSVTATGLQFITRESGLVEVEVRDALGLVEKRVFTLLPRLTGPLDFEQLFESQAQFQANLVGFKGSFRPIATWPHQVVSWDFGDGTRSSDANPTHTYTRKGRYTVILTVLDKSGCLITHSKVIDILDYFIEIPNVFTPNGDNLNDTFFPKFSFIPSLQLQVMNKWGELIYRSHGLEDAGWDGTAAGQKAPEGVYVYMLSYQVPDGRTFTSSSTFLLAR